MTTFTVINDETLVAAIQNCTKRLVYVAPGISEPVALAIGDQSSKRDLPAITVIVDLDPEVCRLGYGTEEGLKKLQEIAQSYSLELRYQPGLRVGLLIVDDAVNVYAPTPQLIEAGSDAPSKPNAIVIGSNPLAEITHACAANAPACESSNALPMEAEIGRQAATPAEIEQTLTNLKEIPPKRFDIARVERVFNTKIQYVELEVKGYRLSSKKVTIPNYLLVGDDQELGKRIKNSFSLLQGSTAIKVKIPKLEPKSAMPIFDENKHNIERDYDEATLENERKKIYDDFLLCVNRYGWVIMRSRRDDFDKRIACFKADIKAFAEKVKKQLKAEIINSVKDLAKSLLPKVKDNPPECYRKFIFTTEPSDEDYLAIIEQDLFDAFGSIEQIFSPDISVVFKDVTYESINDEKFRAALADTMRKGGGERMVAQLFSEYDAAPESN
ncbi:hypothetical protein [Methylotuvimicrobium sp. KM2]|uniref:hypothetical protein n=1 Tax=Methylotuvimicrobium sp. KM2 TaxID=3133976 RepID=UPI0031012BBD